MQQPNATEFNASASRKRRLAFFETTEADVDKLKARWDEMDRKQRTGWLATSGGYAHMLRIVNSFEVRKTRAASFVRRRDELAAEMECDVQTLDKISRTLHAAGVVLYEPGKRNAPSRWTFVFADPKRTKRYPVSRDETDSLNAREEDCEEATSEEELLASAPESESDSPDPSPSKPAVEDPGIEELGKLVAYVKRETGRTPKTSSKDPARIAALIAKHGRDEYTLRAAHAVADDFWRAAITDRLGRFLCGFDAIGEQMPGEQTYDSRVDPLPPSMFVSSDPEHVLVE